MIPAYNEEGRLPALLDALTDAEAIVAAADMRLVEILIVDDGSSDGSRAILRRETGEGGLIAPVFDYELNRGKGAAIAAGVKRAEGEYVLFADVDLSTPLEELTKLVAALRGGADLAIGSRALPGAIVERGPFYRKVLGNSFNAAVRLMTGLKLRDTQDGFKLLPTWAAQQILAQQTCPGFSYDVELLMRADSGGLEIAEVPIRYVHDSRSSVPVVTASFAMLRDVALLSYRLRVRGSGADSSRRRPLTELPADDSD